MDLYILILLIAMLLMASLYYSTRKQQLNSNHQKIAALFYIAFIILIYFRDRGWDYELYKSIYEEVNFNNIFLQWTEPGFLLTMIVGKFIGLNFNEYSLFLAATNLYLIYKIIEYFKINHIHALLFFVLFFYFRFPYGQIRQSLSIALFLYSLIYINSSKFKFSIINLLALSLHFSAASFIPFFLFHEISKLNKLHSKIVLITTIGVFGALFYTGMQHDLASLPGINKLLYYQDIGDQVQPIYLATQSPLILISVFSIFLIYPRLSSNGPDLQVLFNAYLFGLIIFILLSWDLRIADRASAMYLSNFFLITAGALKYLNAIQRIIYQLSLSAAGLIYLLHEYLMMKNQVLSYYWTF